MRTFASLLRAVLGLLVPLWLGMPARADDDARALLPGCRVFKARHGESGGGMAFSHSGGLLASTGPDGSVKLWDPAAGKELRSIAAHDSLAAAVAFAPDDKLLASAGHDRLVKLWDPATGKPRATLRGHEGPVVALAFSPDGKRLASAGWDRTIRLWDVTAEKELAALKGHTLPVVSIAFNSTGDTLVSGSWDKSVRIWNVKNRESSKALTHEDGLVFAAGIAADGRTVASCAGFAGFKFWELPSGVERPAPRGVEGPVFHLAFSPDGRMLAAAGAFRFVQLWEVASGRERAALAGPGVKTSALAFSGDGRWLGAAAEDGSLRAWERTPARPARLSADELRTLWSDLGGEAGAPAYRAILALSAAPGQSVPFLKNAVKPITVAEPERVGRLVAQLDSEQFAARQQAEQELERLAEQAGPALRKALEGKLPSLEVRRRLERLVQKLDGKMLPIEQLQAIRGVEALENIDSPEAKTVLEGVAAGAPGRLTTEAQASLRRLRRQPR